MDFTHTDDRRMLTDSLQKFISHNRTPLDRAALATAVPGYEVELWRKFAELGAIGALFSPETGGFAGAGFDIMVVFEAVGRGLLPEPFLSTLMVGRVLAGAGGRQAEIDALVEGAAVIAFAHEEASAGYEIDFVSTWAQRDGDDWRIDGSKSVIRDAEDADSMIVSARTSGQDADAEGISLFLIPRNTAGVSVYGYPCIDGGRAAEIGFEGVRVPDTAVVGVVGQGQKLIRDAIDAGLLALCAEAFGAMERVRDETLQFLRTRIQFGEPIGRNQSLQHRMASVLIELEQARSAVINAAAALDGPVDERARALSGAKYTLGKTGTYIAEEAIQLHGGIGMTSELAMTHFAKRLMMINHQLGDDDFHLSKFVALGRIT